MTLNHWVPGSSPGRCTKTKFMTYNNVNPTQQGGLIYYLDCEYVSSEDGYTTMNLVAKTRFVRPEHVKAVKRWVDAKGGGAPGKEIIMFIDSLEKNNIRRKIQKICLNLMNK
jgi:hypothetical protein